MDRSLDSLSSEFAPLAYQWVARVVARGVAVLIVQTSRTLAEHQANLAAGTSGTSLSMHLPRWMRWPQDVALLQADRYKADAMDVVPFEVYQLSGPDKLQWNSKHKAFGVIGEEAERVGLRWGGRFIKPYDPGHAELVVPWKQHYLAEERARPWPTFV